MSSPEFRLPRIVADQITVPPLYPAGDCIHCGLPIEESHLFEFVAGGGHRPVTVLVHTGSGHERCEGRETFAERSEQ